MSEQPDAAVLMMHSDEMRAAIVDARARTGDPTVMARCGDHPPEGEPMPGLFSIERDGAETVYGLSDADALAALNAL